MRRRRLLVLLLWPMLTITACSGDAGAPANPGGADPLAAMQLENGKRWTSDDHTRQSIAAMRAVVNASASDLSPTRTTSLGKQLQELADKLIQGCTMTGLAHNALHTYLGVLLPGLQRMAGADAEAAGLARTEVTAVLARFTDYFQ